jgi:hypothetical protein
MKKEDKVALDIFFFLGVKTATAFWERKGRLCRYKVGRYL